MTPFENLFWVLFILYFLQRTFENQYGVGLVPQEIAVPYTEERQEERHVLHHLSDEEEDACHMRRRMHVI
jgi:hypothetical protein